MPQRRPHPKFINGDVARGSLYPSFAENWNGGSETDPHVASIMLGRGMAQDIAVIGMFEVYKVDSVLLFSYGRVCGIKLEAGEEFEVIQEFTNRYSGEWHWDDAKGDMVVTKHPVDGYWRSVTPINHPRHGLRCTHAMTGRSL